MKIQHKYLRNRHFRIKHWKRIRAAEQPFKTTMPSYGFGIRWSAEEQIKNHFEYIEKRARTLENGGIYQMESCPKWFRHEINMKRKAAVRRAMVKINAGELETELPTFKNDAAWLYW